MITISLEDLAVPDHDVLNSKPLDRAIFYAAILAAIADEANEIHVDTPDGLGPVWCRIGETQYEMIPFPRETAENEFLWDRSKQPKGSLRESHLTLKIGSEQTDADVLSDLSGVMIRFPNPATASREAAALISTWRRRDIVDD
jgi:hypothetical protein